MYCRKCGTELPSDGRFCPKCGTATTHRDDNNECSRKCSKKKGASFILAAISLLIVFVIGVVGIQHWNDRRYSELLEKADEFISNGDVDSAISCWEKAIDICPEGNDLIEDNLNYYRSVKDAKIALNDADWNLAIDYLDFAIGLKPDVSENYLLLATAYVENWDLYNANKTLVDGYTATQSKELKNVSIWGPLSLVETAYYMTENMPITRCEYLFSDNGINSYVYAYGDPIAGASYLCENGKVKYITLLDYDEYSFLGLFPQQMQGIPVFDSVQIYFEVEYNENNQMSAVTYAGTTFITLEYDEDESTTVTAKTSFGNRFSAGDNIKFNYNEDRLISEIIYGDTSVNFQYDENRSCLATIPSLGTTLQFDSAGLLIGLSEPGGRDSFVADSQDGRILSYEMDGVNATISYENGKFSSFDITRTLDTTVHNSIRFFYDEISGADRLVKMEYTLPDGSNADFHIYYDSYGRISRIINELDGYDMTLSYTDNRLSSYELTGKDLTTTTYLLRYDNAGRYTRKVAS